MDETRTARIARVWAQILARASAAGEPVSASHACAAAAQAVGAFGAGLSMARDGTLREQVLATDPRSAELGELQQTLSEGPCVDALNGGETVLVADMRTADSGRRWPAFAPAALALGVGGMFSVPVRAGAARLGVLDLYRDQKGPLTSAELTDALAFADVALVLALDELGGIAQSGPGDLLDAAVSARQAVVHQAAGMVSVQLDLSVTDALARLRGYAYAQDRRLTDVAADVVARRLRFRPEGARQHGASQHDKEDPR